MEYFLHNSKKDIIIKGMVICLILFLIQIIGVSPLQAAPATYTWNATVGCFTVASNWTPARTTPATDDILTFDGSVVSFCTTTTVAIQSIGQLNVINGCTVTFTANVAATLSLGTTDVANPALFVDTNSQLILGGANTGITLALQPYSLGTVKGDVVFSPTGAVTMALTSLTTNGIVFTSGASLQNAPKANVTVSPFSGSTVNSVVFQTGSAYYMAGTKTAYSGGTTGDPWFSTRPASIVNFLSGSSCYIWNPQTGFTTFAGRTVGNLIIDNRAKAYNIAGNSGNGFIVIQNDLIFKGTSVSAVSTVNQGGIRVGGNFIVESGSAGFWDCEIGNNNPCIFEVMGNMSCAGTFVCNTATNGATTTYTNRCYLLDGSSPQTLYLGSNIATFGQLSINNASGITLLSNLSVATELFMNNGNINTNGNTLSLGSSIGGSVGILSRNAANNPWIIGNFQRWVPSGSAVAYGFPVGASHYDGATIDFSASAPSVSGYMSVSYSTTNPGDNNVVLGPDVSGNTYYNVSSSGYWTINNGVTLSGNPNLWLNVNDISGLPTPIAQDGIVGSAAANAPPSAVWATTGTSPSSNAANLIESAGIALPSGASYYGIASPTTTFLPPIAGFYGSPISGYGPLLVNFTDTSANTPTSWNWTFGDGSTSTIQNPAHLYADLGVPTTYSVNLIVSNTYGSSTVNKLNYISVSTSAVFHGGIIWDFDTLSPATILHQGYLYLYGYTNTNGVGGSNAIEIDAPYKGVGVRHGGQAVWMSNFAGFSLNSVAPYNGPIGNPSGNINLSVNTIAYFSILASNTSSFGICFTMYDTTGSFFVPNGKIYLTDTVALQSSISTTGFQKLKWNIAPTHAYRAGHSTGTAPVLTNIEAFEFFFATNKLGASGSPGLKFWIDNVGATVTTPVELWNLDAIEKKKN